MLRRRVYVDGLNVIGSRPDGWWRDRTGAMARLVRDVAAWAAREEVEAVVVLDGRERDLGLDGCADGVRVVWAPGGRNAGDDELVRLVGLEEDPVAVEVVTSDRELARRVRALGAQVRGAAALRRALD
ncbi:NYN domain-containing protein [Conexibacter sp. SYSU D00693]|uniref:NYN domain-containing protein n=1 Tax=Conexibacter sp. SYSU D00693 TaxID=2812560 RepID=UPI00196B4D7A|nr:NYN domain-containing protein [Conexibacter sp. SYSU D00693]